jgi:hypothetical protein
MALSFQQVMSKIRRLFRAGSRTLISIQSRDGKT